MWGHVSLERGWCQGISLNCLYITSQVSSQAWHCVLLVSWLYGWSFPNRELTLLGDLGTLASCWPIHTCSWCPNIHAGKAVAHIPLLLTAEFLWLRLNQAKHLMFYTPCTRWVVDFLDICVISSSTLDAARDFDWKAWLGFPVLVPSGKVLCMDMERGSVSVKAFSRHLFSCSLSHTHLPLPCGWLDYNQLFLLLLLLLLYCPLEICDHSPFFMWFSDGRECQHWDVH